MSEETLNGSTNPHMPNLFKDFFVFAYDLISAIINYIMKEQMQTLIEAFFHDPE